ncbi:hypothetical protein T265_02222 [Opisthorchis viverrini]|uniref:Tetratricopeptide repeat protein n=1 Tax=Opisthorchis viverrini TaxID=6198 RepID=A0A075A7E8_OPIVI|nr:hypothetical protein T265_02222 [Opisthorchis viverrini]KER31585.1 hypothetical protein T265_02222 [Opisthorchis viverrini]
MKEHWLKAIHANPGDSVTLHALGRCCGLGALRLRIYPGSNANLPRHFSVLHQLPPTKRFVDCDWGLIIPSFRVWSTCWPLRKVNIFFGLCKVIFFVAFPNQLPNNALYLAKTYQRLKKNDLAKEYCERVLKFTDTDLETEEVCSSCLYRNMAFFFQAKKEATDMLKNL